MYEEQLRQALTSIRALRAELAEARAASARRPLDGDIAVVGIGCRFPGGADSPEAFAERLEAGYDAIRETPPQRWRNEDWYDPDPDAPGRIATRWGGFLDDLEGFDPGFFELSQREADEMDPQQRLLLETSWEALERAAIAPASLSGSRSGVFVGINGDEYYQQGIADPAAITAHTLSGGVASAAAGRIAYLLGLQGPALAIDTACSSSLAAVHLACRSLRSGEVGLALAGGVYVVLEPKLSVGLSRLHMFARDGRCKPFDARADGFVQGEGAGMLVLKRLADARAAGDPLLAIIRGSAMNQDGRSVSLTAPSRSAQRQVLREALDDAGVEPRMIGFIETHGTGTALGDPIECHALVDVFGAERAHPLLLGAVKSNIGHLGPAAGVAGLIKAVMALARGRLPPNRHFERFNPAIDSGPLHLQVPKACCELPRIEGRRLAGVSSFGFAGTNVHLVLESVEAPQTKPPGSASPGLLLLSAPQPDALAALLQRMREALPRAPDFAAVCRSAANGRNAFDYRVAIVAEDGIDAVRQLALATPHKARARVRLALMDEADGRLADWLKAAGISPYAMVGSAAAPAGSPVPCLDASHAQALGPALIQLGICVLVCGPGCEPPALDTELVVLRCAGQGEAARLGLLGHLFELGFRLDPAAISLPGPRIALPVSVFQRQRCWRERVLPQLGPLRLPGEALDSPLPGRAFRLPLSLQRFPWLGDHRVAGRVLVPGAFQLACLLRALACSGQGGAGLRELGFPQPIELPESGSIELCTVVEAVGRGHRVRLCGRAADGGWVTHAEADVEPVDGRAADPPASGSAYVSQFDANTAALPERLDGPVWLAHLRGLGIEVGPAFAGLQTLWRDAGHALAQVAPVEGRYQLDGFLHPALLDACLQAAGGALPPALRDATLLPIGIARIVVGEPVDAELLVEAHCRESGAVTWLDLIARDRSGVLRLQVEGLQVRALKRQTESSPQLVYQLAWQPQAPPPPRRECGSRLWLAATAELAAQIAPSVDADERIEVFASADLDAGLGMGSEIAELVYCAAAGGGRATLDQAMALARRLAAGETAPRLSLALLGQADPLDAALLGLAATLALEQPASRCRLLQADSLAALLAECRSDDDEAQVHHFGDQRQVARLRRQPCIAASAPTLRGTLLISGGFGAVGRALAEWGLQRGAEGLLLLGRNPDADWAEALQARRGRPVRCLALDLAQAASAAPLAAALQGMPPLRAIHHAAGAQAPGLLADIDPQRFAAAFDAKAQGALFLHLFSLRHALDEFLLVSSIAGLLGAAGQGGYAPANALLDGLALTRRRESLPGQSVRLGRLAGGGMADQLDAAARARLDALGLRPLPIPHALEALSAALTAGLSDPLVADVDWSAWSAAQSTLRPSPLLEDLLDRPGQASPASPQAATASLREQLLADIRQVGGITPDREVDTERSLVQLGFDSLMAMELRNRWRRRCGEAPAIGRLLGDASLRELLDHVDGCDRADESEPDSAWENLIL